jgi:hypothetical protein
MFFDEPAERFDRETGPALQAVVALSAAFILFFILSPGALIAAGRSAAAVFFAG